MATIQLPRFIINQILDHARQTPESEVCGLIAAKEGHPVRVLRIKNVATEPDRLFAMDPEGQIDAMRRMRQSGETLFAIYHSHPKAPAMPSPRDMAEAAYPEAVYLIVSLNMTGVLDMRGFRLGGDSVEDVDLEMV